MQRLGLATMSQSEQLPDHSVERELSLQEERVDGALESHIIRELSGAILRSIKFQNRSCNLTNL